MPSTKQKNCIIVNDFLKNKFEDKENTKYQILRSYYEKRQIKLFYGESEKYANKICNYFTDALA